MLRTKLSSAAPPFVPGADSREGSAAVRSGEGDDARGLVMLALTPPRVMPGGAIVIKSLCDTGADTCLVANAEVKACALRVRETGVALEGLGGVAQGGGHDRHVCGTGGLAIGTRVQRTRHECGLSPRRRHQT